MMICKSRPRANQPDRDTILAEARKVVQATGGKAVSMREFSQKTGIKFRQVWAHFRTWCEVLRTIGIDIDRYTITYEDNALLADWGAVARKFRRTPKQLEYGKHGEHSVSTLRARFGGWPGVHEAFRKFAHRNPEWNDVLPLLQCPVAGRRGRPKRAAFTPIGSKCELRPRFRPRVPKAARISNGHLVRGSHIGVPGMPYAPVNELGVICLFTLLAHDLGFEIEAIQTAYPDCEAARRISDGTHSTALRAGCWQTVRIEFEYESRSFRAHAHPPSGCDIIVCWVHNWKDCPSSLEVIELSQEVERLTGAVLVTEPSDDKAGLVPA